MAGSQYLVTFSSTKKLLGKQESPREPPKQITPGHSVQNLPTPCKEPHQFRALWNNGIPLISLFAFVAVGRELVHSIKPLFCPKSVIFPIASANLPFHFPWLLTKPENSFPTWGWTANLASEGRTTTPCGGFRVSL